MRLYLLIPAAMLSACTPPSVQNAMVDTENTEAAATSTPAPLNPPGPGEPGGLDNDMTPVSEAPFAPDSAQGAANVVQTYYALIEEGKYAQAYQLWEPGAAGMSAEAFAASFAGYSEVHANIGAPDDIDAGAGQRHVTVPVQFYGRRKDGGKPFNLRGSLTLHRSVVDGATPEQKAWRISGADLKPLGKAANP
jgi:hypothetical protein